MITSYALHKAGSISLAAGAAIMLGTTCESAPSLIPFPPVHKQHHQKSLKLALDGQSSSQCTLYHQSQHLCVMLIHCISKNIGETNPNRSKLGETSGCADGSTTGIESGKTRTGWKSSSQKVKQNSQLRSDHQ